MNRRDFIINATGLIAGLAIQDAVPLGRVYSFPSKIVLSQSMRDSQYFVRLVTAVTDRNLVSGRYTMMREELYDRAAFWAGDDIPVKVNYIPVERDTQIYLPS